VLDAPAVPSAELKEAVRFRVKDIIDYPFESATIDVLDIPVEEGARNHSVYAVSARNELVGRHVLRLQGAEIPLEAIDIPELAQRNVCALAEPENRGVAMLAFDHDGGLLTMTYRGELYSSRRIETTLPRLTQATPDARAQLHDRIALELQRSLDHFDRQFGFITLAKLLLGPMPDPEPLREYLASNLYVPVEAFDLAAAVDLTAIPDLRDVERQAYCLPILGAALRDAPVPA
jgi:MSHA biogenesis protein MshI